MHQLAQTELRDVVCQHQFNELLANRDKYSQAITRNVEEKAQNWGVAVEHIQLKNIDLVALPRASPPSPQASAEPHCPPREGALSQMAAGEETEQGSTAFVKPQRWGVHGRPSAWASCRVTFVTSTGLTVMHVRLVVCALCVGDFPRFRIRICHHRNVPQMSPSTSNRDRVLAPRTQTHTHPAALG